MRLRVEVAGRKGGSGQCWQLLSTGTGMGWGRGEGGLSGEPGKGLGVRTKEDSAKHPPPPRALPGFPGGSPAAKC